MKWWKDQWPPQKKKKKKKEKKKKKKWKKWYYNKLTNDYAKKTTNSNRNLSELNKCILRKKNPLNKKSNN